MLTSAAFLNEACSITYTEMRSETQAHSSQIIRMWLPTCSGARDGGTRGSAPAEEGCDSRAGVQQGALAAGRRVGRLLEPGWLCRGGDLNVGCCEGEPANSAVPSRWLESSWVVQLRAGLLLQPRHIAVSRRRVDTLSLIYRHRFVVRSWCLQDSADFTLA